MYGGNTYPVAAVAMGGTIALTSGWNVFGWTLLGISILAATVMTVRRNRRRRG
jgi:hypothetical protein